MIRSFTLTLSLALLAACGPGVTSESRTIGEAGITFDGVPTSTPAKHLFGSKLDASNHDPAVFGGYSKGCLAGSARLPETGPTWQAMRLDRNRYWGHPELIDYLKNLSAKAAEQPGWKGLYIGDLSQPRGGPMRTGHRSHQTGLDADIWMLPATRLDLTRAERESISSISTQRANGAYTGDAWTPQHHEILKAAAKDPRVARIFVFPGAKVRMCDEEKGDRSWLRRIRPWGGHHYHFHVRLSCPPGDASCVNQNPPPPGDGCEDARKWVENILNPPEDQVKRPPSPDVSLADLPEQCARVLTAN